VMFTPVLSPHGALMLVRSSETEDALVLEVERGVRVLVPCRRLRPWSRLCSV
jgi:hypothetical protein